MRERKEERRFHSSVIVTAALVSSLVVSVPLSMKGFLLSLDAHRQAGMIYIVFVKVNGGLWTSCLFPRKRRLLEFDIYIFQFFLNNLSLCLKR